MSEGTSLASGARVYLGAGIAVTLAGVALLGVYVAGEGKSRAGGNGGGDEAVEVHAGQPVAPREAADAKLAAEQRPRAEAILDAPVSLVFDNQKIQTRWRDLGVGVDENALGHPTPGNGLAVAVDRDKGLTALVSLKDAHDRPAVDAHVDLDTRTVVPEKAGYGVHVYESLIAIEDAARAGKSEVVLAGAATEPAVTMAKLGNLDISAVLGSFETHFPPGERDRNYNLRLVASHVNGHIIMPHEVFSFNEVVGDRTEKQGYHVAHVIQAGEMVDGLAGGACQISSTLHGAAWFAGLDLVKSRPHSRPSAYITMGMDATVVYPTTDLQLGNPYDFPVVIRYVLSQGTVRVEILGKNRPWDKIAFEREVKKELPFETVTRQDDTMPVGSQIIEQMGFPGYNLIRRRIFYKDGAEAKVEKWPIQYPPTTEYVRIGTNPDPNLKAPEQREMHGPMGPGGTTYHMEQ